MHVRLPFYLSLASGLLAAPSFADVRVVNASGHGEFTSLAAAVTSAKAGDVLLVKSGNYGSGGTLEIPRGVAIVEDKGHSVRVNDHVRVVGVTGKHSVVFAGLELDRGLELQACTASIRIQDCEIKSTPFGLQPSALEITDCPDVVIVQTELVGRDGSDASGSMAVAFPGHHGLTLRGGKVAIYDSWLGGGWGGEATGSATGDCYATYSGDGGHGAFVDSGNLYAMGTQFYGGNGGAKCATTYGGHFGDSATAIDVLPGADVQVANVLLQGGTFPGPSEGVSGIAQELKVIRRSLIAPAVVRENETVDMTVYGRPGDVVIFLASFASKYRFLSDAFGVQTIAYPTLDPIVPVGTVGGAGTFTMQVQPHALPTGAENHTIFHQVVVIDLDGTRILGGAHTEVTIAAGF